MKVIHFHELNKEIRTQLIGCRWVVIQAIDLPSASAVLMLSELEDVLVAVDHRGKQISIGPWVRAVHLLLVDSDVDSEQVQQKTGITRVIASDSEIEHVLW